MSSQLPPKGPGTPRRQQPSPFKLPAQHAGQAGQNSGRGQSPFKVDGMTAVDPDHQPLYTTPRQRAAQAAQKLKSRPIGLMTIGPEPVEMPMEKALAYSTGVHVFGPLLTGLIIFLLMLLLSFLLNINLMDMFKRAEKKPDMVFTLVQDTGAKRPDTATMRGEFNQKAGGENDPKRELTPFEKQAKTQSKQKPDQKPVKPTPPKPEQKPAPTPKQQAKPPQPKIKPLIGTPKKPEKTQPVVKSTEASQAQSAQPSQLPMIASVDRQAAAGTATNQPNYENGSGAPGVNVQADLDFGPYMAYLKRTMKRNWAPPKSASSKRVVVRFIIAKDGRLLSKKIVQTSGDEVMDQSALSAVDLSAPFRPLPSAFREDSQPIDFDFDLNIMGKR